jgi:hypothetical protein
MSLISGKIGRVACQLLNFPRCPPSKADSIIRNLIRKMKPENIATTRAATLYITYKSLIRYTMLAALCLTVTTRANATLMAITFDDGGKNTGSGVIDVESGYAVSGDFTVTAGLAAGDWTLFGETASSPGAGTSPNRYFNFDNIVFLG